MQKLIVLIICLFSVAASQKTFYCNSPGITDIRERDFYLITRRQGSSAGYSPGMRCSFTAVNGAASQFYVEISQSQFSNAHLTIKSDGSILISAGSTLPKESSTLLTRAGSLTVLFETFASGSHNETGVRLRVRAVQRTDCPPDWYRFNDTCFGTSAISGMLAFASAQIACNRMLSNLLQISSDYRSDIWDLLRQLPPKIISPSRPMWIGMTDIEKQFNYKWLSGARFDPKEFDIGCGSNGRRVTCSANDRCAATVQNSTRIAIYMSNCSSHGGFICSMQPGGDKYFYRMPVEDPSKPSSQGNADNVWYILLGIALLLVFVWCYFCNCCCICITCCCDSKVEPASSPVKPVEEYRVIAVRRVN